MVSVEYRYYYPYTARAEMSEIINQITDDDMIQQNITRRACNNLLLPKI